MTLSGRLLTEINAPAARDPNRGDWSMAEAATRVPVKSAQASKGEGRPLQEWRPFAGLRQEIDRLFNDFDPWRLPSRAFFGSEPGAFAAGMAVDIVEKERAFEVTAELPGLAETDVHVELMNGSLRIHGEKKEEKEEKRKDYYLSERRYGSFERRFPIPEGVDADKIDAVFKQGVLTITLPKTAEAQKSTKTIAVKAS
jgi:HSP20 family protein